VHDDTLHIVFSSRIWTFVPCDSMSFITPPNYKDQSTKIVSSAGSSGLLTSLHLFRWLFMCMNSPAPYMEQNLGSFILGANSPFSS